jgi:hypothetical protein
VPCVSIVCSDDRVASAEWGRWAARERLLGAIGYFMYCLLILYIIEQDRELIAT